MDSNGGTLGKLLPKSITAKRRRRKNQQHSDASSDDLGPRGRSPASSRHTIDSDATSGSFPIAEENDAMVSSQPLLVLDSDQESISARPTAVSTHPSQIGYLTTSSPIVQQEHVKQKASPSQSQTDLLARSATFSASRTDSLDSTSSSPSRRKTGLSVPQGKDQGRSPSPSSRFREVFRSRGTSSGTGSPSPERRPGSAAAPAPSDTPRPSTAEPAAEPVDTARSTQSTSTERFRRLSRGQKIDTTRPPQTPPSAEKNAPVIVNTPPTPTDHNNPTNKPGARPASVGSGGQGNAPHDKPKDPPPAFGNMIPQRRIRSGSGSAGPSKLSNITLAPLSPTPENGPNTASAAGFFSSMFSAAQNAANTLSNSIANTNLAPANNGARARGLSDGALSDSVSSSRVEVEPFPGTSSQEMGNKEPAVRTLGKGDLSLSQLGIAEPSSNSATPLASRFPESTDSRARSESAPVESQTQPLGASTDNLPEESQQSVPNRSQYDLAAGAERTTPAGSVYDDSGIHRSGSVRSALGRTHRKRGSSAATGGTGGTSATIAAAIAAANASVAHPSAMQSTTKLTGFAVASKKRNRDFHGLFKTVPDDDYLIEDYSCALQREILAHGRLYVSEGHLCFSSNIFGWTTTLVMSFDEIVAVEKRSTALVFKNGLMISTLHAKHVFASFTSRDSTYDLIVKIWKLGHPSLQSSLNGVNIDEMGGDKTEKIAEEPSAARSIASQSLSGSDDESEDDEDDVYDEDEEEEADGPATAQPAESRAADADAEKAVSRRPSGAVNANGTSAEKPKEASAAGGGAAGAGEDFPGPATHAPTECGDTDTHFDKFLADDSVPAPLGKVYNMTFGPASTNWMSKWLTGDQKCFDLQMEDQKGLGPDNKARSYSYIKPLNASLGPRQTKCIVAEHLDSFDLEKSVNITCTTQTPDVPSGNVFNVKTKYCLSWGENNTTRIQVNCTTEWTGKSWLKGPIEKGVIDGQTQYCKDLFAGLKAALTSRPRAGTGANGAAGKGKKKGRKGKAAAASSPASDSEGRSSKALAKKQDWGMFEPIHGIVGPVVDILQPLMTGNVVYGLLVGLLVATWFGGFNGNPRGPSSRHYGADLGYLGYPDRVAAYEEMWRREESELWEWLEERVGMERLNGEGGMPRSPPPPLQKRSSSAPAESSRRVEEKIREARTDDREIREAIKVTEEKLKTLKATMDKKVKGSSGQSQ